MLGRRHPTVRLLRALRSDPSARDSEGLFLAEGIHLAEEALAHGAPVTRALFSARLPERPRGARLLRLLEDAPFPVDEISAEALDSIMDARSPQPVVLLVERPDFSLHEILDQKRDEMLIVVTVGLQDPGNLGSIMRTAEAAGASALVATGEHVDLFHPRAVRATAGSIFRFRGITVDSEDGVLDALEERGASLVAATAGNGITYDRFDWTGPCALLLGRESSGLPGAILDRSVHRVTIPLKEPVESLSVGAAAAVLLFEACRQRRPGSGSDYS